MTCFDFLYTIGCGFSLLLAFIIVGRDNMELPKNEQSLAGVMVCSLFLSLLSWGFPLFCLAYNRYFLKGKKQ